MVSPIAAQGWQVQVVAPSPKALLGWAQTPPEMQIKAALLKDGEPIIPRQGEVARLFLTGQVFVSEKLVDNVPLWDDGTHGDEKANDGIFTSTYRPPKIGEYQVRVRAQADLAQDSKTVTKEFWSDFVPFRVVPIPYPHLISPEPASKTRLTVHVRARLLQNNQPFEEHDESLQAKAAAFAGGEKVAEVPLKRSRSVLTGELNLPQMGSYQVVVTVSVLRQGKRLSSQSQPIEIQAVRPPIFWLVVAISLGVLYLLLPPKQPPLRYKHQIQVGQRTVEFQTNEEKTVNGLTFKAKAETPQVTVKKPDGEQEDLQEGERKKLQWREGEQRREAEVRYLKAEPIRDKPSPFSRLLPFTFWRILFLALALSALALWWYQWQQISR